MPTTDEVLLKDAQFVYETTGKTPRQIAAEAAASKALLLSFVSSLTLSDHMGDVAEDIGEVLKRAGIEDFEWNELSEVRDKLDALGVKSLYAS